MMLPSSLRARCGAAFP